MRFGFHISIKGGFRNVPKRAINLHCDTIQFFSRSPRSWKYSVIEEKDVEIFKEKIKEYNIYPVFLHLPYLPNFATSKDDLYQHSISFLKDELIRADLLGVKYVIIHPGSSTGLSIKDALTRVVNAINIVFSEVNNNTEILIENTAGQGTEIGKNFDEIKKINEGVDQGGRIGVVLDTAHLFEYGYEINTEEGINRTLDEFNEKIGREKLRLLHLNDSKTPLGSRKDRHWHIGEGEIGKDGFSLIINHPYLRDLPGIMETPRRSLEDDFRNMKRIKDLVLN